MHKKSRTIRQIRLNLYQGGGLHKACEVAGISYVTLWTWRNGSHRIDNYIRRILESRVQLVEDALYKGAISGNTVAQIFYLKNRGRNWNNDQPGVKLEQHTHFTYNWEGIKGRNPILPSRIPSEHPSG